jgi:hypothetical protein
MTSPQKKATATPRQKRGVEFLLWSGILFCVVGGAVHFLHGGKAAGEKDARMATSEPARQQTSPSLPGLARASRAVNPADIAVPPSSSWEEAVRAVNAERNSEKREALLASFVDQIAIAEIPSALDALQRQGAGGKDLSLRLLRRWAESDAQAASRWAEQLPESSTPEDSLRSSALEAVAIVRADASLEDASAWVKQLPDSPSRNPAILAVANEAVRSEPMEALRLAVDLPADAPRDQLIQRAAMEWATKDPGAARDWGLQITEPGMRNQVLSAVATAWSENDPKSAAALAYQEISGQAQSDAVIGIVQRWAQKQPQAAVSWVQQFPDGPLKQAARASLTAQGIVLN